MKGASSLLPPILLSMVLIILPFTAGTTAGNEEAFRDAAGLDPRLTSLGNDGDVSLIVQTRGPATGSREDVLSSMGFDVLRRFHVVPGFSILGSSVLMDELISLDWISYIEINDEVELDMEMGTNVINATQVWSTYIRGPGWESPIDGSGVTVCVVDTGIDAGHPDMDYGKKTIMNVLDAGGGNWVEMENSDTNYGHGTHVAGTVAGNGDASAGARRGVAPGANLIGVTVSLPEEGRTPTEDGYIQGLEWVYDHSRPGANPHNIRLVTNSWHSTVEEYNPETMLTKVIEKLTFENNVVSTWSAGNDGRDDPEGAELTTSGQGNAPIAIMVAAYERDGSAVTDFSSRGRVGANHTYPDVGAPGRSIWSCSARRTVISMGSYVGGNSNPYYLAISGTSMSTPHVAGLVALLWQACPSMDVSPLHEDYSGDDPDWWYGNEKTVIHDAEWILEASARFLPPTPESGNVAGDTNTTGWWGKPIDYVQGYGIVDAKRAVGIALTLERLRAQSVRKGDITVGDAIRVYDRGEVDGVEAVGTTTVHASWSGEYSRYNDQSGNPLSLVNQTKHLVVPRGATEATIRLTYTGLDLSEFSAADLAFELDTNGDGSPEHISLLTLTGGGVDEMTIGVDGDDLWTFDIIGRGVKIPRPIQERSYVELRLEYGMSVTFTVPEAGGNPADVRNAVYAPLLFSEGEKGGYRLEVMRYDLRNVSLEEERMDYGQEERGFPWLLVVIILAAAASGAGYYYWRRKKRAGE